MTGKKTICLENLSILFWQAALQRVCPLIGQAKAMAGVAGGKALWFYRLVVGEEAL